jgi:hypothetical protein
VKWLNSLRCSEPDLERNGLHQIKRPKQSSDEKPAKNEDNASDYVPVTQSKSEFIKSLKAEKVYKKRRFGFD